MASYKSQTYEQPAPELNETNFPMLNTVSNSMKVNAWTKKFSEVAAEFAIKNQQEKEVKKEEENKKERITRKRKIDLPVIYNARNYIEPEDEYIPQHQPRQEEQEVDTKMNEEDEWIPVEQLSRKKRRVQRKKSVIERYEEEGSSDGNDEENEEFAEQQDEDSYWTRP